MTNDEWKKQNSTILKCRVTNSGDLMKGFQAMMTDTGLCMGELIRKVLSERLQADGYMEVKKDG